MIFVVIWLFDHFSLEPVPPMNSIWIIAFVSRLHAWATKFKPSFMFFQLPMLTSNNVIWVGLFAILFNETQDVVKTPTRGYVPVCYEVINLFIKLQNIWLMFFICKLKGLYLIIFFFNGLLMPSLDLFNSCIKLTWYYVLQDALLKCLTLDFSRVYSDIKGTNQ